MEQEIAHLQDYLEVQKIYYGEADLTPFFDLCGGLDQIKIPALLLQPIVENAIVHGVEGQEGDAVVFISVSFENRGKRNVSLCASPITASGWTKRR